MHNDRIFDQFSAAIIPFQASEHPERIPQGIKAKLFSSAQSEIILDDIEDIRVSADFETLSIPGAPLAMSSLKGEAMLEAKMKVDRDFTVGDKRLSS